MTRYPYLLGQSVEYGSCVGSHWTVGKVTGLAGPFTVLIDDKVFVPVVLVRPSTQEANH